MLYELGSLQGHLGVCFAPIKICDSSLQYRASLPSDRHLQALQSTHNKSNPAFFLQDLLDLQEGVQVWIHLRHNQNIGTCPVLLQNVYLTFNGF